MNTYRRLLGSEYNKVKLSVLWLFAMLHYIYADILTLMDSTVLNEILASAVGEGVAITPTFLFFGAILMEIPIAMVVLSLILRRNINRWANILAGAIKTLAVGASAFVGEPALYYVFFVVIEVAISLYIVWVAWTWASTDPATVN